MLLRNYLKTYLESRVGHAEPLASDVIRSAHVQTGMHRVERVEDGIAQESRPLATH